MFQDLDARYDNAFRRAAPAAESIALLYREDGVLARVSGGALELPRFGDLSPAARGLDWRYAFSLGERECFAADWAGIETPLIRHGCAVTPSPEGEGFGGGRKDEAPLIRHGGAVTPSPKGEGSGDGRKDETPLIRHGGAVTPSPEGEGFGGGRKDETPLIRHGGAVTPSPEGEGFGFVASREFRAFSPKEAVFAAAVGESLHRWYGANRFCGRCGAPMADSETERARVCPACGLTVYPKICPAVIAAVTDGDRLLLTKYQGRAFKRFALVAGFNEIGESIEDTVRREVREETGLEVRNLRFYKSQPWVFTDSLLMGFWCELAGSDAITLQRSELSEAGWYRREEIPEDYSPISLTGEMIGLFRDGRASS